MKLEVGMYVRTKDGRIDKIEDIRNDFIYIENSDYGYRKDYFKASHNIIDLIEVGDYVNGGQVREKTNEYIRISGGKFLWEYLEKEQDIKSIVTKEQFESMQYVID